MKRHLSVCVNFDVVVEIPMDTTLKEAWQTFQEMYGYSPDCFLDAAKTTYHSPTYTLKLEVSEGTEIVETRTTVENW